MAQSVVLGAVRGPSPLVSIRVDAEPLDHLPAPVLKDLLWRLTNQGSRGDYTDAGVPAGSHMRNVLDDLLTGYSKHGHWAALAWPVASSLWKGPVAWTHLQPEETRSDCVQVGFYCAPEWRRRGLGRTLVDESLRLAHRLGYRRLVAHPWNARSHAFFLGAGFMCVSRYANGLSGLSELEVPQVLPPRPTLFRCKPPEV